MKKLLCFLIAALMCLPMSCVNEIYGRVPLVTTSDSESEPDVSDDSQSDASSQDRIEAKGTFLISLSSAKQISSQNSAPSLLDEDCKNAFVKKKAALKRAKEEREAREAAERLAEAMGTIDPTRPIIAITFDDGPSAYTARLLEIFEKHGGKATFFVVGSLIRYRPNVLRAIAENGHEIGSHTWSHPQLTKLDRDEIISEITRTREKIFEVTGIETNLVRPPYGSNNELVKSIGAELGITYINWSLDTLDWLNRDPDAVYNAVMKKVRSGAIILCHDIHPTTIAAMERIIPDLIDKGYQLLTVSQLMYHSGIELESGRVYNNAK